MVVIGGASALQREVEELLQFVYLAPVAIARLDEHGEVEMLNPKAVQLLEALHIDSGRADGATILEAFSAEACRAWRASDGRVGEVIPGLRCSVTRPQGDLIHLLLRVVRPDPRCTMLTIEDITVTVEQERELGRQRQRLAIALEHIRGFGVAMLDQAGTVTEWNASIGRLLGEAEETLVGSPLLDWQADDADGPGEAASFSHVASGVARDGWCQLQAPWRRSDGSVLWGDCMVSPLVDTDGTIDGYVAVIRDATDQRLQSQQLINEALTDPLTGLFNRRGLQKRLSAPKRRATDPLGPRTWVMVDIDHFKRVNDTYGHDGGDAVLKAVAHALQQEVRDGDTLARLGGEEFVLAIPESSVDVGASIAEVLRRRVEALTIGMAERTVHVTASFGVAVQAPGEDWTLALERADAALYRAKGEGRNRVVLSP